LFPRLRYTRLSVCCRAAGPPGRGRFAIRPGRVRGFTASRLYVIRRWCCRPFHHRIHHRGRQPRYCPERPRPRSLVIEGDDLNDCGHHLGAISSMLCCFSPPAGSCTSSEIDARGPLRLRSDPGVRLRSSATGRCQHRPAPGAIHPRYSRIRGPVRLPPVTIGGPPPFVNSQAFFHIHCHLASSDPGCPLPPRLSNSSPMTNPYQTFPEGPSPRRLTVPLPF